MSILAKVLEYSRRQKELADAQAKVELSDDHPKIKRSSFDDAQSKLSCHRKDSCNGSAGVAWASSAPNSTCDVGTANTNGKSVAETRMMSTSPSWTRRVSEPEQETNKDLCELPNLIGKSPSVPELTRKTSKTKVLEKEQNMDRRVHSATNVRRGTRSQWAKLRSAVQSVAVVRSEIKKRKMSELQREDSFLRRFSTRSYARRSVGSTADSVDDGGQQVYAYPEELEDNKPKKDWTVLRLDGSIKFYWMCVVCIAVFYNMWVCIAREAFHEIQESQQALWIFLDILADLVYLVDILAQFRTGYLEQGLMVTDTHKLIQNYLHSVYFYLDIIAVIPLDFLQFKIGIHPMIRSNRFIKFFSIYSFIYMVESRTSFPNLFRVMSLVHILLLGCHWFAGLHYMISEAENFSNAWTYPPPNGTYASVTRKYLRSLYWSTLTLTTIGDLEPPFENIEYLFVIVSYLIGVFIFATIVGQVGSVITNRNSRRQEFERLVDSAKTYMRRHNVPKDMRKRVMRWYDYVWARGRVDGKWDINTLGLLPDKLKTELAIHVNLQTLRKVTIFQECQPEFLHDLVLKMKAYIFTPGDVICRYGEVAREMFIIADGVVEVISDCGTVLTRMNPGDFFGEIGILNLDGGINRRTADVRSVGYSELFVLSRDDVLSALEDHPDAEIILKEYGRKRLDAIRRLNTFPQPNSEPEAKIEEEKPEQMDTASDTLLIKPQPTQQRRQSLTRSCSASCIPSYDSRRIEVELMRSLEGCSVTRTPVKQQPVKPLPPLILPWTQAASPAVVEDIPSIVIEPASPDRDKHSTSSPSSAVPAPSAVELAVAAVKDILIERWKDHENTFRSVIKVLEDERKKREGVIDKMQKQIDSLEAELSAIKTKQSCDALRAQMRANARASAAQMITDKGSYGKDAPSAV